MSNPSETPTPAIPAPAPRGPVVRQFTYRLYSEKQAERFDALSAARFGGKTGLALEAVFDAGLDALASAAPATADSIAIKSLTKENAGHDSAPNQRESGPSQSLGTRLRAHLSTALGCLTLAVSVTALGVALRTPTTASPAAPAPEPTTSPEAAPATVTPSAPAPVVTGTASPIQAIYATTADLAKLKADLDRDLDEIGLVIREVQAVNRQQTVRLDILSPAPKPASLPGR